MVSSHDARVALRPLGAVATEDGGFIVVGADSGFREAWAVKTDATGKFLWRYDRPIDTADQSNDVTSAGSPVRPVSLEYRGAVPIADGSIFLCGSVVHRNSSDSTALITQVDKNGHFEADFLFKPPNESETAINWVGNCVLWHNKIIVVGGYLDKGISYFWLIEINAVGRKEWEKQFSPISPTMRPKLSKIVSSAYNADIASQSLNTWHGTQSISIAPSGDTMALLANDGANGEIDLIDPDGNLVARRALPRAMSLIQQIKPNKQFSVYGLSSRTTDTQIIMSYKYDNLNQSVISDIKTRPLKYVDGGFEFPDGSFLFYGASNGFGRLVPAGLALVDRTLKYERHLPIEVPDAGLGAPGVVAAVSMAGEYLIAIPANPPYGMNTTPTSKVSSIPGVALVFVKLNPIVMGH